jgi:hypothetical protein
MSALIHRQVHITDKLSDSCMFTPYAQMKPNNDFQVVEYTLL